MKIKLKPALNMDEVERNEYIAKALAARFFNHAYEVSDINLFCDKCGLSHTNKIHVMNKNNAGRIVELTDGRVGRIYNKDAPVNGKLLVYLYTNKQMPYVEAGKRLLVAPENLKLKGYIN